MKELIFLPVLPEVGYGYLDGPCKLPEEVAWPVDGDGKPLFHLLSIPFNWVKGGAGDKFWLSVFVLYDREKYSHYGEISQEEDVVKNTKVILHDMSGQEKSIHPHQSKISKSISNRPAQENDDNVASYVGGTPYWVQDPIEIEGQKCIATIYGPDMDEALGENRGIISDGVGYVFIKDNIDHNDFGSVGNFYVQLG
ncbi:hypothetical protein [Paracidovorax avenae]|uniref:hypothetical protein n=1 Tax=Paracidovorax avenae TaxID=80867 RepID=UPI0012603660|nr:hypothetical protein [Paracidovorax avenae]